MDGIENASHDLKDASFSIETAIDLLSGIAKDEGRRDLVEVIEELRGLRISLASTLETLASLPPSRR